MSKDEYYMQIALDLAKERKGLTHPNPTVGCVIVKDDQIVAKANHEKAGALHAEAKALQIAGPLAKGATLYVTLEPCNHFGRTPPCTDAIIKSGVKRVVIATLDPNPLVCGEGIRKLKEHGIEVVTGVLEEQAKELNEDFFVYITQKRPYVTLKFAQSIDGKTALENGESKWITSQESREHAHQLRKEATAILVGINTILRDDPLLTVRYVQTQQQPVRIVLDPHLKIPLSAKVVKDKSSKTIVVTAGENREKIRALEEEGVDILLAHVEDNKLNLQEVLRELYFREIMHILVEGGSITSTSFVREKLFDRVFVYIAPMFIGKGKTLWDIGIKRLQEAPKLKLRKVHTFGHDVAIEYRAQ